MEGHLLICGDLLPTPNNYDLFINGDSAKLFGATLSNLLEKSDYAICNLEGVLTHSSNAIDKSGPCIKAEPDTIKCLRKIGFNAVTLANNHIIDYGLSGYIDTITALNNAGIQFVGSGTNKNNIKSFLRISLCNKSVIIYNVAETEFNIATEDVPGVNRFEEYRVCSEISKLKNDSDIVIVIYHGGIEKYRFPSPNLKKRFHLLSECGADFVLAQHSHCIGSYEKYNESILLYGQGNFCFCRSLDEFTRDGLVFEIIISDQGVDYRFHRIIREDSVIRYDDNQELEEFHNRSIMISDDNFLQNNYSKFCRNRLASFIDCFQRDDFPGRLVNKIFGYNSKVDKKYYNLAAINMLRCEAHHEAFLTALLDRYHQIKN